ncbi:hypothetical protein Trco_000283, partial [Trichoderma cornu-damae]
DLVIHCNQVENELRHESQRLVNAQIALVDAANARTELQRRVKLYENYNPYVMVLIDGDGLMFRDTWIKQGLEGGKKVAYALRSAVAERFGEDAGDLEIVAKVVANLAGLAKAMQRDGCIDNPTVLKDFTLGFTQAKATFDYIDVGYGKERADSKIKETTRWHLRNHNCKHILLGISHDAGYAPFLDETLQSEATRQRISIIEGVTAVPDLVATNVSIAKLGNGLFRDDKLLDKFPCLPPATSASSSQSTSAALPAQAIAPRTASPAISAGSSQTRTPTMSYAGVVSNASPPPQITLPLARKPMPSGCWRDKPQVRAQSESQYQLIPPSTPDDWNPGLRGFDEPIRVNTQVLDAIKKRKDGDKLCNNHCLRGPCAKRDVCPFSHDYKTNDEELKAIAVLARQNPCSSGQHCELDDCIYGHHCPSIRDGVCVHPFCKFAEDAHPPGTKFKNAFIHAN